MVEKMISLDEFTLEELEQLEQLTGMTFTEIAENSGRPKVIKILLWLSGKRTNPNLKIEEVASLSLKEATALVVGDEDPKE